MNTMTYKRYTGTVEYSAADGILWGRVLGIKAMIDYEGESIAELRKDFETAIDHYLAICKKRGVEPDKPRGGQILLTLPLDLELYLEQAAEATGKSPKAVALDALQKAFIPSVGKAEPIKRKKQTPKPASKRKPVPQKV